MFVCWVAVVEVDANDGGFGDWHLAVFAVALVEFVGGDDCFVFGVFVSAVFSGVFGFFFWCSFLVAFCFVGVATFNGAILFGSVAVGKHFCVAGEAVFCSWCF